MKRHFLLAMETNGPGVRAFNADSHDAAERLAELVCRAAADRGLCLATAVCPVYEFTEANVSDWLDELGAADVCVMPMPGLPDTLFPPRNAYER